MRHKPIEPVLDIITMFSIHLSDRVISLERMGSIDLFTNAFDA